MALEARYTFDDAIPGVDQIIYDTTANDRDLAMVHDATAGNQITPVAGPGTSRAWRVGSGSRLTMAQDATITALLTTGPYTIEGWIRPENVATAAFFFGYMASGETLATNALFQLGFNSSRLRIQTESGAGVDQFHAQPGANNFSNSTWQHWAVTCSIAAGTATMEFWLNGVSQGTTTGTAAAGGTTATLWIGEVGGQTQTVAAHKSIRISNIKRSNAEILAAGTDANGALSSDANTIALWKFDEDPQIQDQSGNARHLRLGRITAVAQPAGIDTPTGTGKAIFLPGNAAAALQYPASITADATLQTVMGNDCTWQAWVRFSQQSTNTGKWGLFQSGATGGAGQTLEYEVTVGRVTDVRWDYSLAGVDTSQDPAPAVAWYDAAKAWNRHHVAIVKERTGNDGTYNLARLKIYVDGVLIETTGSVREHVGSGTADYAIGWTWQSGIFHGTMDDVRIYSNARTAAEILADYELGMNLDSVGPVISITAGDLNDDDSVTVDVTDAKGASDLAAVVIKVVHHTRERTEVVYQSSAFADPYVTDGVESAITNGRRFVFSKLWDDDDMAITVLAVDAGGNVATASQPASSNAAGLVVTDTVDPVITVISTPTTAAGAYVVDVHDAAPGLLRVGLFADLGNQAAVEVIHDGNAFQRPYATRSTRTGAGTTVSPYRYTIYRDTRWPEGVLNTIKHFAIDTVGNMGGD